MGRIAHHRRKKVYRVGWQSPFRQFEIFAWLNQRAANLLCLRDLERFIAYMDDFLQEWMHLQNKLNKLPVSHRDWTY